MHLLHAYEALPAPDPSSVTIDDDRDLPAWEDLARAAVAGARRARDEQLSALRRAITRWQTLRHELGELRATVALARVITDPAVHADAQRLLTLVPHSWLHRDYLVGTERAATLGRVSPAEYRVLVLLVEGLSTSEIALRLKRSTNTIRNQTRTLFGYMGVHTRSALVARCVELGVVPSGPKRP